MHSQVSEYLDSNLLLADTLHDFRAGHSTIDSIAQLTNYISQKQDGRLPTLVTYIDFRKALTVFNTVYYWINSLN